MSIESDHPRASLNLQEGLVLGTATLHEAAGRIGALPSCIHQITVGVPLVGTAFPVELPPGDNLLLHHAVYAASPGDVLVVSTQGGHDFGYWGEILSVAAAGREVAGLVIDGCVRDGARLAEIGLPVFARGLCIRGTGKDPTRSGSLGVPVSIGDVEIRPGDFVLGDGDGVLTAPIDDLPRVLESGRHRAAQEAAFISRLQNGATTLELYDLSPIPSTDVL